eukprot:1585636-Prorocentrum_lima.AAC.1
MMRTWRAAQKRGQEVGIPALGGNKRFTLLVKLISKLEAKHSQKGKNTLTGNSNTAGRSDHGRAEDVGGR